jgi:alcohol dehydrogenase
VRSLGCDEVIDYTIQDISKAGGRYDAGFDLIGGTTLEQMFEITKSGTPTSVYGLQKAHHLS